MKSPAEILLVLPPEPERPILVRAVRSTLVTSGLVVLRQRGLYDRYLAALEPRHRETVGGLVAATWLPTTFMLAHYAAWDSLGLTPADIRTIGSSVASAVRDNLLFAIKRIAEGIGGTPWTVLAQYGRIWTRAFDGGGVRVERDGPKEATIHYREIPFAGSAYFRGSIVAIHELALGLFATKMYARVVPKSLDETAFALRLSWV